MSSCEFIKKDQQRCKHSVAEGQRLCWQHAKGWSARFRALPKNARLLFWIAVASLALTGFGVWLELFSHSTPASSVHIETSGDHSPVVQDNHGTVEFNEPQSTQPKKKPQNSKKPNVAEGSK